MAGSKSDYLENKVLDHCVGKTAFTMPTTYLALCTADPTDAGTGASMNEVADSGSYARKATAGLWAAASSGAIANNAAITFTEATGSWGTITHWALVDSGTHGAGNVLYHGSLDSSQAIVSGNTVQVPSGDLDITEA